MADMTGTPNQNPNAVVEPQAAAPLQGGDAMPSADPKKAAIDAALDQQLENWKKQLLDTGKRNRMINFTPTRRSTLKIEAPEPSVLFNRLAFSDKALTFQKPISKATDPRAYAIISLMETLSYDLDVHTGDIKVNATILEREITLKNLRAKAKLAQDEQGINILYLCFGFVDWRENNHPGTPVLHSPLLMMPVSVGRKTPNAPFTLSRYNDDIEVNPTLDYFFNTEYGVDLPTFELSDSSSLENYFTLIEGIVSRQGWALRREVWLGLVSFLKISMYHDLNNNRSLIREHPVLRAIAGDATAIPPLPREASDFDFDSLQPGDWHEVVDSDSSQEEAILLSKRGISFVMQGPPGTGKSQTITNIIAEALGDGKKVLFVSEKAAALQVVLKRLADVGLDDFCLSLHDYKANKKQIITSIGANLHLKDPGDPSDALSVLTELFHDRQFLNQYAEELHRKLEPLGKSAYEIFGKLAGMTNTTVIEFYLDDPAAVTKQEFARMQFCVDDLEKALQNLGTPLHKNPWHGTAATSSSQMYHQQLVKATQGLSQELRQIRQSAAPLADRLGLTVVCFRDALLLLQTAHILAASPSCVSRSWFDPVRMQANRQLLTEAKTRAAQLQSARGELLERWQPAVLFCNATPFAQLAELPLTGLQNETALSAVSVVDAEYKTAQAAFENLSKLHLAFRESLDRICWPKEDNLENARTVSRLIRLIASAPELEPAWFNVKTNENVLSLLHQAEDFSSQLRFHTNAVLQQWNQNILSVDAEAMLRRFNTEYRGMFHVFNAGYQRDMRQLKSCALVPGTPLDDAAAVALLQHICERNRLLNWFGSNSPLFSRFFGKRYRGAFSDWELLRRGLSASRDLAVLFPGSSVPETTASAIAGITADPRLAGEIRRLAAVLSPAAVEQILAQLRGCAYLPRESDRCSISRELLPQLERCVTLCRTAGAALESLLPQKKNGQITCGELLRLTDCATAIRAALAWFDANGSVLKDAFGDVFVGADSDWETISRGMEAACELSSVYEGSIPETVLALVCGEEDETALLQASLSALDAPIHAADKKLAAFDAEFDGAGFPLQPLETVADRYDACMGNFLALSKWLDYAEARAACDQLGLSAFTDRIAAMDNCVPDVKAAFERGFYLQWLSWKLKQIPAVNSFRRRIYEQRAARFVELDTKQYELSRNAIRARIISEIPGVGASDAGSELGILNHEMAKKCRFMALRKLFHSIPHLLLTLKPCLMMSPLSVAYFLNAEDYRFDMVIFDEASQIFPQDAIGAIFRAKQVIIAGDTKQLPPTNFFVSNIGNKDDGFEDDEDSDEVLYDSILEQTAPILPNRPLLWHYRSRHEHLIAFSNHEFYDDQLITFPGSSAREPDTGIDFVYVEDGYYEPKPRNYNLPEARRIVSLIEEHIHKHPERSLGVIAFSESQQEAILNELQRLRAKHPEYEAFFAEGKEGEFFVKNLENVQGDERDTIFFSIGYAKTKEQKAKNARMYLRFGPLGAAGGERRLNVAITRAKINIKLVSSILYSDIDETRTNSAGILMLRSYLRFAMDAETALAPAQRNHVQDEFVDAVAQFIREQGYTVRTYVGCSDFKLDIAVCDPADPDSRYAAGILCDGYSCVSARTARDRDRLRTSVLTRMGWNLYRVWSCEWNNNPDVEGQKLLAFLRSAVGGSAS